MPKKMIYYAGFCDNKIGTTEDKYYDSPIILSIFLNRKDARKQYQDVRQVKLIPVKKGKMK